MKPHGMTEQQIIDGCKERDGKAQRTLYEKYARIMFAICLRYSGDGDSAKDLMQDGFIKVFMNIDSYKGAGSFEGWMKRIFINLALENIRKTKNLYKETEDIENIADLAEEVDEKAYEISEADLMAMIHELPTGYATVFNLYAIEEYSHKEIAEMLDISEGTSRSQYVRARQALQEKVKAFFKQNS